MQAHDALPGVVGLVKVFSRAWLKSIDAAAFSLGRTFASGNLRHSNFSMLKALRAAGMTVKFNYTPAMHEAFSLVLAQQVSLIRGLAQEHLSEVEGIVLRSAQLGRDLGYVTKELTERYDIDHKRAAFIARDQNNKATAVFNRVRQLEIMGPDAKAIWVHSGAGKHPRPDHVRAGRDKLVYKVSEGAFIDGEYIHPGELPNCRCTSRLILH